LSVDESPLVVAHLFSESIFKKHGIDFLPLSHFVRSIPVSIQLWIQLLIKKKIKYVFSTTSSPYKDISNCNLICAARKLNVPVLGVMDHWKGFDRFFNNGKSDYLPDQICCIDQESKNMLQKYSIDPNKIHITGHPYLESICFKNHKKEKKDKVCILLISQPVANDRSFLGIFLKLQKKNQFIDRLIEILTEYFSSRDMLFQLSLRMHPKEKKEMSFISAFSALIKIDQYPTIEESIKNNDIFIGLNSMALVEAYFSGNECIELDFPILNNMSDRKIEHDFFYKISTLSDIPIVLDTAIKKITKHEISKCKAYEFIINSKRRTLEVLYRFLS